mgnify:CR=1 FL=1
MKKPEVAEMHVQTAAVERHSSQPSFAARSSDVAAADAERINSGLHALDVTSDLTDSRHDEQKRQIDELEEKMKKMTRENASKLKEIEKTKRKLAAELEKKEKEGKRIEEDR